MNVCLNLLFLGERAAGVGRYVRELIPALLGAEPEVRVTCVVARDAPTDLRREPWAGEVRWSRVPLAKESRLPLHVAFQLGPLPLLARRLGADVLHSPANVGPMRSPGMPTVMTVHDLVWIHHPEQWESAAAGAWMRRVAVRCARRADRVLAISEAVREDLVRTLGLDAARIDVAPHGVRADFASPVPDAELRARLGLGGRPFVLCVAQKRPYKNQEALVRALPELDGVDLVLPGEATPYEETLRELARELGVAERVHLPGWVTEAELEGLYWEAACFALPTLFEGFGMPVLEAMARGVPVACSGVWSVPEVAGDAALLFDPRDQAAVTAALRRLIEDPHEAARLAQRGRERAREFTWERAARATLQSYRRALSARRSSARS